MHHRLLGFLRLLIVAVCGLTLIGCSGQKNPFQMAQVSGRVAYADGRPIEAAGVTIFFLPENVAAVGHKFARPAEARLKPDGSFSEFSTAVRDDGVIVGRHKVVLMAWNADTTPCASAVAKRYSDAQTTPLAAEVSPDGPNRFEFTVEKGP